MCLRARAETCGVSHYCRQGSEEEEAISAMLSAGCDRPSASQPSGGADARIELASSPPSSSIPPRSPPDFPNDVIKSQTHLVRRQEILESASAAG